MGTSVTTAGEQYAAAFDSLVHAAPAPRAVQALRQAAFDRFIALGFPTTRDEDWHYTSVAPIAESEFTLVTERTDDTRAPQLAPYLFSDDWHRLVFVNGKYAPELSRIAQLPEGAMIGSLERIWKTIPGLVRGLSSEAVATATAFSALNMAFLTDGAVIHVGHDTTLDRPVQLLFVADATAAKTMIHPHTTISLGRNARATVIESYVSLSDARYFTNGLTNVELEPGASLNHYKIQRESARAFHVGTIDVKQARDSHYQSFSFATGAELSRTNVHTRLDGEGCGATLNGLYMIDGDQTCDHQTQVIHAQPNTYSRELYKGILDGRSHGVFNGKVYVHPIAQKTDGKQTNKTLLLSDKAHVDTKPQLEIFADDVKCTHGATIGQIDRTALFYLKSRGIGAEKAMPLLTYAFAADAIETIEIAEVRDELERLARERFVAR
jgi:Fe-S cluster assembly protein SufD